MNRIVICLFFFFFTVSHIHSQVNLSVQGSIQNSSGAAIPDGQYEIIFNIYDVANGGEAIWTEIQPKVEIIGGLYSCVLGLITPLTESKAAFNFTNTYYLGVSIKGKTEVKPRAALTPAAYSLSVSGKSNVLPSQGSVGIGIKNPDVKNQLHIQKNNGTSRILVEGRDTARLKFKADSDSATISFYGGNVHISNYEITFDEGIKLSSGKTVSYAGNPDWRLIEYDDFTSDTEGWQAVAAWNNATRVQIQRFSPGTPFSKGFIIRPNANASSSAAPVLVKEFNLTDIPHTSVKVVFTYHFFDSWDYALSTSSGSRHEFGYGAFSTGSSPSEIDGKFQVGWRTSGVTSTFDSFFSKAGYTNLTGSSAKFSDHNIRGSMVAETTDNRILIYFGSNLNGPLTDESFGISNVEIWVK
jgi:hypothetical protein